MALRVVDLLPLRQPKSTGVFRFGSAATRTFNDRYGAGTSTSGQTILLQAAGRLVVVDANLNRDQRVIVLVCNGIDHGLRQGGQALARAGRGLCRLR